MNNKNTPEARLAFRDWLRGELRRLEFYLKRGDHYLIREFAKYCIERGHPIDEASLGRYLRDENPVLPTPDRMHMLAAVLDADVIELFVLAGYLTREDLAASPLCGCGKTRQAHKSQLAGKH